MYKLLALLPILIGASALSVAAQTTHSAQPPRIVPSVAAPRPPAPPVALTLAPLEMKGMRGAQPVTLDLAPFEMKGMRGASTVTLQLSPFEMKGMRGATPTPTPTLVPIPPKH